jgi:hypothetical protein
LRESTGPPRSVVNTRARALSRRVSQPGNQSYAQIGARSRRAGPLHTGSLRH